jgi:hypothetical protein
MMAVSVRSLDDLPDPRVYPSPHELQTAAYTRGIKAGEGKQTAYVFLTPDILLGDGTLRTMVRLTEAGKRVVIVAGIRMSSDGAVACVARHRLPRQAEAPVPPRSLVRYCLDNLHPISVGHVVTDDEVHGAQHLYWKVGDHGLLVRGFHLHPLVVWPSNPEAGIRNTLDDEYIAQACPDQADWHTVTDSDEMCVIEFSERTHKRAQVAKYPLSDYQILQFMVEGTTPDHREHVRRHIRFHTKDLAPADWAPVIAQSDQLVTRYLELFQHGQLEVPLDAPLVAPPLGNALHGRLDAMFGRTGAVQHSSISIPRLLLLGLGAPVWVLYRILNHRMYRYLDRMYAELLDLRNLLYHTRLQLNAASTRLEKLTRKTAELFDEDGEGGSAIGPAEGGGPRRARKAG